MTWYQHHGGGDPLYDPDDPVERRCRVKFRNGQVSSGASEILPSKKWRWPWGGKFPKDGDWDIVEYEPVS